jgi:predicted esterase
MSATVLHSLFLFAGVLCLVAVCATGDAQEWPKLPVADGEVLIPAQEWPREPGPRTVQVYIRYPGGSLDNVGADTGLMLDLHNWGGTGWTGTADPVQLANRYDVVAICVDYLQSGPYGDVGRAHAPYDFGYLQALDALRALYFVFNGLDEAGKGFARGRIYAAGGSGGGNVTLMANKLAPRTFACAIDKCGMAKLSDDIASGVPGRTQLNAAYSDDPGSDRYLSPDAQALRFVGHPDHARTMKRLGNTCKLIVVHGVDDASCPVEDAREMAANMQAAGLDVEPHFVTEADLDGKALRSTAHALGDRTLIVFRFADAYLLPDSPARADRVGRTDFDRRDAEVRYTTPNGAFVISYESGYPIGRFKPGTAE